MIPSRATRRWISHKARQYAYGVAAGALFAAVTIKLFWFTTADLATALAGSYGALAVAAAAFIGAIIGIQQLAPQPPADTAQRTSGGPDAHDEA